MRHTRCEVRFTPARDEVAVVGSRASKTASSTSPRIRGRTSSRSRRSPREGSSRASCSRSRRSRRPTRPGKTLIFDEVDAGIGGAVADVVGARLQRLAGQIPGPLHHPSAADCRLWRDALRHFEGRPGRADGHPCGAHRRGRAGRGTGAYDRRCRFERRGPGQRPGDARSAQPVEAGSRSRGASHWTDATGESEYKPKGESESPQGMARKYLIETFGCQMNVHDSERMAGLLDQAGYEPTDDERMRTSS